MQASSESEPMGMQGRWWTTRLGRATVACEKEAMKREIEKRREGEDERMRSVRVAVVVRRAGWRGGEREEGCGNRLVGRRVQVD